MLRTLFCGAIVSIAILIPTVTQAAQSEVPTEAGVKVGHTRLAPVVLHRAFPPYRGQHVYRPAK